MATTAADDLQRDDELVAGDDDVVAIDARLRELHTSMPGIIVSFDASKQTAQVQPAIKRIFRGEMGVVDLPVCMDVPVVFPSGGDFVLTFPVTKGDECLLMFSERAIDFWYDKGGTQLPSDHRFHDLSDAFALVGVSSKPRFLSNVATDATELRTRDGSMAVRVEASKILLGGTGLTPPVNGVVLGSCVDPFTGATHAALGGASLVVMAKK